VRTEDGEARLAGAEAMAVVVAFATASNSSARDMAGYVEEQ